MDTTPNLLLPYLMPSQARPYLTHNEAIRALDALAQLAVLDRDRAEPPADPVPGERHIVGEAAAGTWTGRAGSLAVFEDGTWAFHAPKPGWCAFVLAENGLVAWTGSGWSPVAPAAGALQRLTLFGLGTEADGANPFAARLNKALWTARPAAEGGDGDLRYTLNKEGETDVLSLLLQSGFAGRAEIGLVGDDDLSVRVSSNGADWSEILRGDRRTGEAVVGGLRVSRDIVQNLLPDSGRFNGNAGNGAFNGIAYAAPSYLAALSGGSIAPHAKFVHDNADYGGAGPALDPDVKALIDKIRPADARRYGPEWYVARVTAGPATTEQRVFDGATFGLALTNSFTAMPTRFTAGYYLKALSGAALIAADDPRVARASADGAATGGPLVLTAEDGWKHLCLEQGPNASGYNYRALQILATAGAVLLLAMPKIVFGHADLDPDLGVLMNARMFE